MAKETQKDAKTEAPEGKTEVKRQNFVNESVYSAGELAANAKKIFGTRQECVAAALKADGKTGCTIAEAKGIVEKFLKRGVE